VVLHFERFENNLIDLEGERGVLFGMEKGFCLRGGNRVVRIKEIHSERVPGGGRKDGVEVPLENGVGQNRQ
jgi:hypothetical protein